MLDNNSPEQGEALLGAFEIMSERLAQVFEAVAEIEHVVPAEEEIRYRGEDQAA